MQCEQDSHQKRAAEPSGRITSHQWEYDRKEGCPLSSIDQRFNRNGMSVPHLLKPQDLHEDYGIDESSAKGDTVSGRIMNRQRVINWNMTYKKIVLYH